MLFFLFLLLALLDTVVQFDLCGILRACITSVQALLAFIEKSGINLMGLSLYVIRSFSLQLLLSFICGPVYLAFCTWRVTFMVLFSVLYAFHTYHDRHPFLQAGEIFFYDFLKKQFLCLSLGFLSSIPIIVYFLNIVSDFLNISAWIFKKLTFYLNELLIS